MHEKEVVDGGGTMKHGYNETVGATSEPEGLVQQDSCWATPNKASNRALSTSCVLVALRGEVRFCVVKLKFLFEWHLKRKSNDFNQSTLMTFCMNRLRFWLFYPTAISEA